MKIQTAIVLATVVFFLNVLSLEVLANKEERPCVANFTGQGFGFSFKSKKASTWQEFTDIAYGAAFRRVAQATVKRGWTNVDASKDLGTITGGTPGAGISIVIIESDNGAIRVEATMDLQSSSFSKKASKDTLCASVSAPGKY